MANGRSGKVALLTGGGSGIGRAVVEALAGEGAKVGVLEVSPDKVEELEGLGEGVKAVQGDATGLKDNEKALSETADTFGRLDALVCCVGLWDNQAKMKRIPKENLDAAFDEIFAVNVKSYVLATKVCQETLIEMGPEDHVGAYLYLANKEQSQGVTGVTINSDGGLEVRGLSKVADRL